MSYLVDLEDKLKRVEGLVDMDHIKLAVMCSELEDLVDMDHIKLAVMCSELEDLVIELEPLKNYSLNLECRVSKLEQELDNANSELTAYRVVQK